jgi:hypothetical protein
MQLLQAEIFVTILVKNQGGASPLPYCMQFYFSTISRIPIGQALAHIPQAIHLEVGPSGDLTITFIGHTSTHLPQDVHNFLLIIYTPVLGFCVIAPASQTFAHLPH